jgi:hypothetical protein
MRNKTRLIALLAVIVIGAIGLSAHLFQGTGRQQKELTPVSSTPASPQVPEIDTSDWKVYRNEEYGFEIRYPADFIAETDINLSIMGGGIIKFRLVNNKYYQATNLKEASVVIGARDETEDLANCLKPEPLSTYKGKELPQGKVINGVAFYEDFIREGAAGNWYEKVSYRTLYKDTCYEIALFTHSTNIGAYEPGTVLEFEKDEVLEKLDRVFATFRFIK